MVWIKETFHQGTYRLFDHSDIAHLGEGESKSKFAQGIYIISSYATTALYATKAGNANGVDTFYVYTLEVPDLIEDNHVFSCRPVNPFANGTFNFITAIKPNKKKI